MKKIKLLLLSLLLSAVSFAQVPKTIGFQGFLTDKTTGDPLNGNFDMKFSIFDAATGGTELWFDDYTAVAVDKGLYNIILGDKKPINLPFDKVYFLQIKVGLENLDPRITLTASAYSLSSINASNITAGTLNGALVGAGVDAAVLTTGTLPNGRLDEDLQDLADGSLSGSRVGAGIDAANLTSGSIDNARLDSDLQDLADGILSGSKIGSGIDASNITAGTLSATLLPDGLISSSMLQNHASVDASRAVTTDHIRDNAVSTAKIADGTIVNSDISGSAAIAGTKVTPAFGNQNITTTGSVTAASFSGSGASLTSLAASNISGTLPVANGGTGATNLTGVLIGNGTSAFTALGTSTASQYLRRNAGNTAYEFGTLSLTNSDINAGAAIVDTKLATISTAGKVSGAAITSGTIGGTTAINSTGNILTTGSLGAGSGQMAVSSTGYTRLGSSGVSVSASSPVGATVSYPSIRVMKISGTCAAADATATITLSGMTDAKILSIHVLVDITSGSDYTHSGFTAVAGFHYQWNYQDGILFIRNISGASANLAGRPFKVTIIYEE